MGGVSFGTGSTKEKHYHYVHDFHRAIDLALQENLQRTQLPLMLAGVETEVASYRAVNTYKNLVDESVIASPDGGFTDDELGRRARQLMSNYVSDEERHALDFAWRVCKHVKSNAIVLCRGSAAGALVVGVGAGQMSRVDSVKIAVDKAGDRAEGSVLASDAFFPFRDGLDVAARSGVRAVIQPGGSLRDAEVIAAADEQGVAMLMTQVRHFRH